MDSWINYRHLYYFTAVAEYGTVSLAAKKLRVSQPTLSAQIKRLELDLGVKLIQRQGGKIRVTEHGAVVLKYSKSIFSLGSEMLEVLQDEHKPVRPMLHIGALDSIPKQVIVEVTQFALREASCQIMITDGKLQPLIRDLESHRIDIVITNALPASLSAAGLSYRSFSKHPVALYGAKSFNKVRDGFPRSVSGQPLILPTHESKIRQDVDYWARSNQVELNLVAESEDIATKKLLAVNGCGLIIAARHTVTRQVALGELIEIGTLSGIHEELFFVIAQRKITNQVAKRIWDKFSLRSAKASSEAAHASAE